MNAFSLTGPSIARTDSKLRRSGLTQAAARRSTRKQTSTVVKAGNTSLRPIDYGRTPNVYTRA